MIAGADFLADLAALPDGYAEGSAHGRRYGVTVMRSPDAKRQWLYAEELGGEDRVSFNLYLLDGGPALRPCEMPAEKVVDFVAAYRPDIASSGLIRTPPRHLSTLNARNSA